MNPIVTLTPLLARPGSHRLAICAQSREAFASAVLELMRQWERVEIGEPSQLPISGWWHGGGRVRNKVATGPVPTTPFPELALHHFSDKANKQGSRVRDGRGAVRLGPPPHPWEHP